MEKAETRDFMNVDSFSQLPFIRPAPAKEKAAVRLFGIEFQNSTASATDGAIVDQNEDNNNNDNNNTTVPEVDVLTSTTTTTSTDTQSNTTNSRKFECHYCCRNFPTSQALGGHQNAHKRERQHAKRAYLQSAAMLHPAAPNDHHQLYGGVLGYHHHRLGPAHLPYHPSSTSSSSWSTINSTTTTTSNYHNTLSRYNPSSYHSYPSSNHHNHRHHPPPPINGSPLAMWRIPAVQPHPGSANRDRSLLQQQYPPPPLPPLLGGPSGSGIVSDNSKASQSSQKYALEAKKGFQDHVSLDLHL